MKKILINFIPFHKDGSNGGNALFVINLLKMLESKNIFEFYFLCQPDKKIKNFIKKKFKKVKFYSPPHRTNFYEKVLIYLHFTHSKLEKKKNNFLIKILLKINFLLVRFFKKFQNLVAHSPHEFDIYFNPFACFSLHNSKKKITIIYDLQHIDMPFFFSTNEIKIRNYHYENSIKNSDFVLTISNFSRERIIKEFKVSADKVFALHLPPLNIGNFCENTHDVSKDDINIKKFGKYFYIPSNFWEHKNHLTLFIAINLFISSGIRDYNFVFSGVFVNPVIQKKIEKFIESNNLNNNIFFLGYVEGDVVKYLYENCVALIYPSLYEGFGMPIEEARFFKKPSLISNIPVHREVASKESVLFFDPQNPEEIFRTLKRFLLLSHSDFKFKPINIKSRYDGYLKFFEE